MERVLVCYIPALDLRRVSARVTPYMARLLESCPWTSIRTLPNVDHVPTMLTGTYPHEHGLWGVKLRPEQGNGSPVATLVDGLPDLVTTTAQCVMHALTTKFDLATMPTSRRRRFETKRFKFVKHTNDASLLLPIGGLPSIFTVLKGRSTFLYHSNLHRLNGLLQEIGTGQLALEFVELHSLDSLQHWNLDRTEQIAGYYREVDDFVRALHEKCARNGIGFVLLSDHGMEPTTGHLDLLTGLRRLGLSSADVSYFIENTKATFWLHTDRARSTVGDWLASQAHGRVLAYQELARYHVRFGDRAYGDVLFVPQPGWSIFPNDFYHPIANLLLGFGDWQQRARVGNPRHRGDHGYLPESESERGFMLFADQGFAAPSRDIQLIDVAPSLLALLGREPAETMKGESVFARVA